MRDPVLSRDECTTLLSPSFAHATVSEFQRDYVNTNPASWTAVSLALNDTRDELGIFLGSLISTTEHLGAFRHHVTIHYRRAIPWSFEHHQIRLLRDDRRQ